MVQEAAIADLRKYGFTSVLVQEAHLIASDPARVLLRQVTGAVGNTASHRSWRSFAAHACRSGRKKGVARDRREDVGVFKRIRELLEFPKDFVLHSLRHTFGTRLGDAGADVFTIMRLMGHSTVTVSQRYVHPSPEAVELAFGQLMALNMQKVGTNSGTVNSVAQPKFAQVV